MTMLSWVKLPTAWVQEGRLAELRWSQSEGSNNIAALAMLIVLAHHANQDTGKVQLTYDVAQKATELSRPKISAGLKALIDFGVLRRDESHRSCFQMLNFDPKKDWGKLPLKGLYSSERIPFICELSLRNRAELNALKMLLLIVTRRDNNTNEALMTYETIEKYSGIERSRIRKAITILAISGLVHVTNSMSSQSKFGISSGYRLADIDPYRHQGTIGRGDIMGARSPGSATS